MTPVVTGGMLDAGEPVLGIPLVPAHADSCSGTVYDPTPTSVEVTSVPIEVESTTDEYFVLYVLHDLGETVADVPVLVVLGENGTTTLAENLPALPKERYMVEKFTVTDPADIDGDCIDDITELGDTVGKNPINSAASIALTDGALAIPDQATFDALSVESRGIFHLKFVLFGLNTDHPGIYFQNTETYTRHNEFLNAIGFDRSQEFTTGIIYHDPEMTAANGSIGAYYYTLELYGNPPSDAARIHTLVASSISLIDDNLAWHIENYQLAIVQEYLPALRESRVDLVFDDDVHTTSFLSLNQGVGFGMLLSLEPGDRPNPRDVVLYRALPNELPRVAGIITTVPQTPLSHVNLRAVQDGVPNAYIGYALEDALISSLIGSYVRYEVTGGWDIRAATKAEVDAHYAASRPVTSQTPQRDFSVTEITPLSEIEFDDWDTFGVKATNVAVLKTLSFPDGTVPDGFAIPFYFYDEFMKHNGFYDRIETMLADTDFQNDYDTQASNLKELRDDIEDAETPAWILTALANMNAEFPEETTNRKYRSSTNNEDLPGFNGAGLYDSKSQKPDEDLEDGLDKSLKEVYASLWNFRAFTERDFNRIDHLKAAMGVLVHPSYQDELVNGVAVSFDPFYDRDRDQRYYVNSQMGEDLVTNPDALSVPEEILLYKDGTYSVLATSNQAQPGQLLMSNNQLTQLGRHLTVIHDHFKDLYSPATDEQFAMEIEFKITAEDTLAIKQARPWIFNSEQSRVIDDTPPTFISATYNKGTGVLAITLSEDISGTADLANLHVRESGQSSGGTAMTGAAQATVGYTLIVTLTDSQRTAVNDMTVPALDIGAGAVSDGIDDILAIGDRTITIIDNAPVVDAGPDQTVDEGSLVTLNATVIDADGGDLTYSWTHDSPLTIQVANDTSPSTTFTAPTVNADTTITFTLTADDGTATVTDSTVVTINYDDAPAVDAGSDQPAVRTGDTVTLSGTASDDDSTSLTYLWTHDSDLTISFSNTAALSTTFVAPAVDADTAITFTLAVDDGTTTATDSLVVTVADVPAVNSLPVINAGSDQIVEEGASVTLAGTAADSDGDPMTYLWSQTVGSPTVALTGADTLSPAFTAPILSSDTEFAFELAVNDGLDTSTDTVKITVHNVPDASDFVTTWQTTAAGESITIPVGGASGTYTVDWGDGNASVRVTGDQTHTYGDAGTYTVRISGDFTRILMAGNSANAAKLQSIEQWGAIQWESMNRAFKGATNMVYSAIDAPDLSGMTSMHRAFAGASSFDGDLSGWDVSTVTDMTRMFHGATSFNGDISRWDVSGVTDMTRMFHGATSFNGDISRWDVSGVTDMTRMFHGATSFNGDISRWDVSGVTDMGNMFHDAVAFSVDLGSWNVSAVTDMSKVFKGASLFNSDISGWDVSAATTMYSR